MDSFIESLGNPPFVNGVWFGGNKCERPELADSEIDTLRGGGGEKPPYLPKATARPAHRVTKRVPGSHYIDP